MLETYLIGAAMVFSFWWGRHVESDEGHHGEAVFCALVLGLVWPVTFLFFAHDFLEKR